MLQNVYLRRISEILVRLNVFSHVLTIEGVLCYFYVEKGTLRGISK